MDLVEDSVLVALSTIQRGRIQGFRVRPEADLTRLVPDYPETYGLMLKVDYVALR